MADYEQREYILGEMEATFLGITGRKRGTEGKEGRGCDVGIENTVKVSWSNAKDSAKQLVYCHAKSAP